MPDALKPRAADLPRYSIVASIRFVFLRIEPGSTGWETNGMSERITDEQVDHYMQTIGAKVLRVGDGSEP